MKYVTLFILAVAIQQSANIASGQIQSQNPLCIPENYPTPGGYMCDAVDAECYAAIQAKGCAAGESCDEHYEADILAGVDPLIAGLARASCMSDARIACATQEAVNDCCAPLPPVLGATPFPQLDVADPRGLFNQPTHICEAPGGCEAAIQVPDPDDPDGPGITRVEKFQSGDVVSTSKGWVLGSGWEPLH